MTESTPPESTLPKRPKTIYETACMMPAEIETLNAAYAAMGLDAVVIDISRFVAKLEQQPDGSYKRSLIRRPRRGKNET